MRITLPMLKTIYNIRQYKTAMWYLYFFKNKHLEVFQNDCFVILILNYNFKVSCNFGNILKMLGEKEDTILLPSNSTKKSLSKLLSLLTKICCRIFLDGCWCSLIKWYKFYVSSVFTLSTKTTPSFSVKIKLI